MTQLCIKSKDHDTLKVLCPLPTYRIGAVSARGSQLGRKKHFIERRRRQIILHDSVFPPIPFNPITAMTDLDRIHFCRILPFFPKQFFVQLLPSIQISFLLFLSRRFQSLFSESRHLLLPPFVCPKDL